MAVSIRPRAEAESVDTLSVTSAGSDIGLTGAQVPAEAAGYYARPG